MTDCVNLYRAFGDVYKIAFDECYAPKHVPWCRRDPWYMLIPCRRGTIYPWGGRLLAVDVGGRPRTVARLRAACDLVQDGDDGATLVFDVASFPAVAGIVLPRRRRRLSEQQRQEATERLHAHRYQSRTSMHLRHAPGPA